MNIEKFKLISNADYLALESPEFVGQTKLDSNDCYYMCWKVGTNLYKTLNKL